MARMEPSTGMVMGQTESLQHLKKAEELSRIVINKKDLYEDKEAWACHQELTSLYRRLLINDLEFSLDKKVEHLDQQLEELALLKEEIDKSPDVRGGDGDDTTSCFVAHVNQFAALSRGALQ